MACCYWIAACSALVLAGCHVRRQPLPVLETVPDFTLTDQTGQEFRSSQMLVGKVWVADFVFTHCPGPCPLMSSRMRKIQQHFSGGDVKLVSFTVDPARDTPNVLAEYGKHFGARDGWYFLTGPVPVLEQLAHRTFKLAEINSELEHSTYFVLVDKSGHIRGYYPTDTAERLEQLIADCATLLKDK